MEREKDFLEILNKKRTLINDILSMTKSVDLNDEESSLEKYIDLIDKREEKLEKIKLLDKEMESIDIKDFSQNLKKEKDLIEGNINAVAAQILELDKINNEKVKIIKSSFKKEMKSFMEGKNIQSAYENVNIYNDSYFDKKK